MLPRPDEPSVFTSTQPTVGGLHLQMDGGLLGLIRQQQPGSATDALAAALQLLQGGKAAAATAKQVPCTPAVSTATCAAAGAVSGARAAAADRVQQIPQPPITLQPHMMRCGQGPAKSKVCHDACSLHVDLSGRCAAASTQTRRTPPLIVFDDFSSGLGGGDGGVTEQVAALQQRPWQPPAQQHQQHPALRSQPVAAQHGSAAAAAESLAFSATGAAVHPVQQRRSLEPAAGSLQQPAPLDRRKGWRSPKEAGQTFSPQGAPLRTCRVCRRQFPAPAGSGTSDFSHAPRTAAAQSLEADVMQALLATLQQSRPQSGGTLPSRRPQTGSTARQASQQ